MSKQKKMPALLKLTFCLDARGEKKRISKMWSVLYCVCDREKNKAGKWVFLEWG